MKAILSTLTLLLASQAIAAPVRFADTVDATFHTFILTDRRSQTAGYPDQTATKFVDVSIDATGPTSYYNQLIYTLSTPLTYSWTVSRNVPGTFTFIPITSTLTIDPFQVSKSNIGPVNLIPYGQAGWFRESQNNANFGSATITGSYSVVGPTETYSGTFTHTFGPQTPSGVALYAYDVRDYPNSVSIWRSGMGVGFDLPTLIPFQGIVDQVPWDIQIDTLYFDGETLDWQPIKAFQEPSPIPEPSTLIVWSLLGASGVGLGWWRRRREAA